MRALLGLLAVILTAAPSVSAHHSFAATYDATNDTAARTRRQRQEEKHRREEGCGQRPHHAASVRHLRGEVYPA
jgi:hypothetical protein